MQRPLVCISHSVWVRMALQTCLGLSTFLCHGWIFSEPLNETDSMYGYFPYRLSLAALSPHGSLLRAALESVWTCFTFQWFFSPPPQSPRFKFSFKHGSELGSCCSFSVSVRCGWGGLLVVWICPLAGRFPQAFHASMLPTDHVTQPQVSEIAWKYISSSFVQFPSEKKKKVIGAQGENVSVSTHIKTV